MRPASCGEHSGWDAGMWEMEDGAPACCQDQEHFMARTERRMDKEAGIPGGGAPEPPQQHSKQEPGVCLSKSSACRSMGWGARPPVPSFRGSWTSCLFQEGRVTQGMPTLPALLPGYDVLGDSLQSSHSVSFNLQSGPAGVCPSNPRDRRTTGGWRGEAEASCLWSHAEARAPVHLKGI